MLILYSIQAIMNKKYSIIFLFFFINHFCTAKNDTITSIYNEGKFNTFYQNKSIVTDAITKEVADYLVYEFYNYPAHLFTWALKDLGLQNKNNELIIVFKSSIHDKKTGITHGLFDIIVPGFTSFRNIKVDAIVTKTKLNNGIIKVNANIIYSSLLLKNAVATVQFIPLKNNELQLVTNANFNFGWFFNFFITKKRYKSIVEWRIQKFTDNLITECETRMKNEIKKSSSFPK